MKKIIQIAFLFFTICHFYIATFAQNVGIGTTTPNPSAVLDVSSNNKGILLPRMTTAQRNAIVNPAVGLTIFNIDDQCTDIFDGNHWIKNCGFKQGDSALIPANIWVQKNDFGGTGRQGAVGFSIGNKGYMGAGYDGSLRKDFWEYDPVTNSWTQKNDFGGTGRHRAVGFSIGTKGYIGTGEDGPSSLRKDFWEYDPGTNTWTQKTDFGGTGRYNTVGFSIGTKGYIGTGSDGLYRKDFWEYDPGIPGSLGTWTPKTDFGGVGRYLAVGFSIGTKGYIGTGYDGSMRKDFWEYNPGTNTWTQKTDFGGTARNNAVGFSIGTKGYIGTGWDGTAYRKDFWEFIQQPFNVANYSTIYSSFSNSNFSDGIWTKTVFNQITTSDNVGIGESIPGFPLNFLNSTGDKISLKGNSGAHYGFGIQSGLLQIHTDLPASDIAFGYGSSNSFIESMRIKGNGNVGIGTTTPGFPLNFASSTGDKISLHGNTGAHYGFGIQSGLLQIHTDLPASDIAFGYGSSASFTEQMRIKGNGNIGIGTNEPNAPLQFGNTTGTPNKKIVLYDANNNDHQFYGLGINAGTLRYQIAETGASHKFYAGTSSTNSDLLFEVNGLGNAWLKGTLLQASDARLKTNIRRIGNTLQNIQQLNGYTYNWLSKDRDPGLQTGLLAQEVQKVYPQLVKEDEKGILSVNYNGLIPVLLEAIKEQQVQMANQQKIIEQQNNRIQILEKKLLNK